MPELPEVEYAAGRLRAAIVGKTIRTAAALHPSLAKSLTPSGANTLRGLEVAAVERRAKIQLIHFVSGHLLEAHFRMTGDWEIGSASDAPPRLERARFTFHDGTRVSLVDGRALGVLRVHAPGAYALPALGPEPLDDAFTAALLAASLDTKSGPIKPVLLDQRVIAGIGNIYAAEALWVARIHPITVANSISRARLTRLRDAIQLVLRTAPTGRYYARAESAVVDDDVRGAGLIASDAAVRDEGERQDAVRDESWRVYGREGEPCLRCSTAIARIVQAGRSTFLCRSCQR